MEWNYVMEQGINGLNEHDEFYLKSYESSDIYKYNMMKYHD